MDAAKLSNFQALFLLKESRTLWSHFGSLYTSWRGTNVQFSALEGEEELLLGSTQQLLPILMSAWSYNDTSELNTLALTLCEAGLKLRQFASLLHLQNQVKGSIASFQIAWVTSNNNMNAMAVYPLRMGFTKASMLPGEMPKVSTLGKEPLRFTGSEGKTPRSSQLHWVTAPRGKLVSPLVASHWWLCGKEDPTQKTTFKLAGQTVMKPLPNPPDKPMVCSDPSISPWFWSPLLFCGPERWVSMFGFWPLAYPGIGHKPGSALG